MEFVKEIEMAKEIEFLKIHSSQLRYVTNFSEK